MRLALSKLDTLWASSSIVFISRGTTALLTFLSGLIVARELGPEGRGEYTLVLVTLSALQLVAALGLPFSLVYHVGRKIILPESAYWISVLVSLGTSAFLIIVVLGVYSLWGNTMFSGNSLGIAIIGLLGLPGSVLTINVNAVNLSMSRMVRYNAIAVLQAIVNFCLCFVLLQLLNMGLIAAVSAWTIGTTGSALAALILTFPGKPSRRGGSWRYMRTSVVSVVKYGLKGQWGNWVQFLNYRLDQLLIGAWLGVTSLGVYSVAVTIGEALRLIPDAINTVLLSRTTSAEANDARLMVVKAFKSVLAYSTGVSLGVLLFGERLVSHLYGDEFATAGEIVPLITLGLGFSMACAALGVYFTASGKVSYNSWINVAVLVVTIALDLILIPPLGIVGAAIASMASYFTGGALLIILFCKANHIPLSAFIREAVRLSASPRWSASAND